MKHEIDTGEGINKVRVPIADTDNVEIVHDKLMYLGEIWFGNRGCYFEWKCETCSSGKFDPAGNGVASGTENVKETCRIDWNKGVKQIYDFYSRAVSHPTWTELCVADGTRQVFKIYETEKVFFASHEMNIGDIRTDMRPIFRWL